MNEKRNIICLLYIYKKIINSIACSKPQFSFDPIYTEPTLSINDGQNSKNSADSPKK